MVGPAFGQGPGELPGVEAPAAEALEAAPFEAPAAPPGAAPDATGDATGDGAAAGGAPVGAPAVPVEAPAVPAEAPVAPAAAAPAAEAPAGGIELSKLKAAGADEAAWGHRLRGLAGMVLLLLLCWALSNNRKIVPWRVVAWGMALQLVLGLFVLRTDAGRWIFEKVNTLFVSLLAFTTEGSAFLFGNLARVQNVPVGPAAPGQYPPFADTLVDSGSVAAVGAFFAFNVLPTIIFFSSLMAVLYHVGVMQKIVQVVAWVMRKTMKTSGSETLSASGNIFVGQTEAPLLVRPFVNGMTQSELMAVMTGGMATVAGGVMAAYIGFLNKDFPDIAGHLLSASVMSAPAALVAAKLMVPEPDPEKSETYGECKVELEKLDANVIGAAARGAGDGLMLALNVGAMLLAFIALISLLNAVLGWGGSLVGVEGLTLQGILGKALAPLTWLMGVPWTDAAPVGELIGVKTVVNEFVAYKELGGQLGAGAIESSRSVVIATYALCGFSNFSSIAIQIGGIGGIAPSRKGDLARLGLRAMVAGTIACLLTATVAGLLI
ncbi:MAG: NupC/NupG family nucleoside CNT transporter [Myxococcales bacterium]|nr:NupC/NupG family nucleoside CNT transporter [Myxococcales bacterium]